MLLEDLPVEILHQITGQFSVSDSKMTLKWLSLTSRKLSHCARAILFRRVSLNCKEFRRPKLFANLLKSNPSIGSFVKNLTLHDAEHGLDDPEHPLIPWHYMNLRTIMFVDVRFGSMHGFFQLMDVIPTLEEVACYYVRWENCEDYGPLPQVPDGLRTFSTLKKLVIDEGNASPLSFIRCLQQRREQFGLCSLVLHRPERAGDYPSWAELLRMSSRTLRTAGLFTAEDASPTWDGSLRPTHEQNLNMLKDCSFLTDLALSYVCGLTNPPFVTEGTFLEAVCGHFGREQPPHRDLETLCLRMMDVNRRMISVTSELCGRLGRVLLDRNRYPRFRGLKIFVHAIDWAESIEEWLPYNNMPGRPFEDARERWTCAFAVFSNAPGVRLEVEFRDWLNWVSTRW
ncbi:hypothetical protein C8Q80DRAFT_1265706 [Daedaleopsis nitida]|nr:hypothetical protein C8Q80DRAFT_1265706 [Daedaleopsis nitida]